MKLVRLSVGCFAVGLLLLAGCVTQRYEYGGENPEIVVSSDGRITAFGSPVDINDLGQTVKRVGVPHEHTLRVMLHTPVGQDKALMDAITVQLMKADHKTLFYFTRPKHATSALGDKRPVGK